MAAVARHLGWLLLGMSCAMAQGAPATLRDVKVAETSTGVQVEVSVSQSVVPSLQTATHPDRLILDFPNTIADSRQQRIVINAHGIRAVRYSLNSGDPPVTRVVVDLDSVHLYSLSRDGTMVRLKVAQVPDAGRENRVPPSAASGGLAQIFRRHSRSSPRVSDPDAELRRPIPGGVSIPKPIPATTTAATMSPTAAHPNLGSLQQGTVFPGLGAPGSGTVPGGPASNSSSPVSAAPAPAPSVTVTPPETAAKVTQPATAEAIQTPTKTDQAIPAKPESTVAQKTSRATEVAGNPAPAPPVPDATAAVTASPKMPADEIPSLPPTHAQNQNLTPAPPAPEPPAQPTEIATALPSISLPPKVPGTPSETGSPAEQPQEQSEALIAANDPNLKTVFRVKYVADGVAYLDGGRSSGLAEGMKLEIKETGLPVKQGSAADPTDPRVVAELEVTGLAETSAVTDIHTPSRPVKVGDLAYLSNNDAQALIAQRTLSSTRQYPIVIAFSEDDPLDEEVRKEVPRPPQPSVNRARGRIGFDYMGTISHGNPSTTNADLGMVMRADFTRIGGTYWNLTGYWRGRLHSQSTATQPTLQDLINRTYHLGLFYDSPESRWVAGVGRLYLPWAPSLDTIDGGYFGTKVRPGVTAGIFAGSTPDPTSWNYSPDRRIAGTFINFEGGDYGSFHYTSTSGLGISALKWQIDRPFAFFENTLSYKRYLSIYDSLQADSPRGNTQTPAPGPGLSRNFLTVRVQVHPRVELNFNHNYLRDIPTFDPALVGTSLLDQYLFQGLSAGARVEVLKQIFVYTDLGDSNRSGDAKHSLNQLYGLTFARLPWWGLRADAHYSRFSSSFADGDYRSVSVGRNITDDLRLDVLAGDQTYTSTQTASDRTRFVNANFGVSLGPRYFMESGFTVNRGQTQNYDQWLFTFGYRFDSKRRRQ